MGNKNKIIDPLPDSFATEEEAGEFWDAHSAADYAEYLQPADDVNRKLKKRVFEVQVAERRFSKAVSGSRVIASISAESG